MKSKKLQLISFEKNIPIKGKSNINKGEKTTHFLFIIVSIFYNYFLYSNISEGWQSSTSHNVANVEKRIAFALPVFNIERFDKEIPTFSDNSFNDIFLCAITTSRFTIIPIDYMVNSFSDLYPMALIRSFCKMYVNTPTENEPISKMILIKTTPGASSRSATLKINGEPIKYIKLIRKEQTFIIRNELTDESVNDKSLSILFNKLKAW